MNRCHLWLRFRQIDPRKLTALLKGELDWVVMKCLEKTRDRRYETASGLARDIERFLSGETVEARPASTSYRLAKFFKRNKGPVIAVSLVIVVLLAGIAGTTLAMFEAWRQEKIANEQTAEKELARKAEADRAEGERLAKIEAVKNLDEAERQKELAESNRDEAVRQKTIADENRKTAERNRDEAIRQKSIAESNQKISQKRLEQLEKATNSLIGVFKNLDPIQKKKRDYR